MCLEGGILAQKTIGVQDRMKLEASTWFKEPPHTPYSKYPLFVGYDVEPPLRKEVCAMETQVFQKNALKHVVIWRGYVGSLWGS